MKQVLRNLEQSFRRMRNKVLPSRSYRRQAFTHGELIANSTVIKFGPQNIRWVFQRPNTRDFHEKFILPWAFPDARPISRDTPADFSVGVRLQNPTIEGSFADLPGKKFLLSVEVETRHPRIANCLSFVQGPQPQDDPSYIRYAPVMCYWAPPMEPAKTRKCSIVESGRYPWRVELINQLDKQMGGVEIFGQLSGKKLDGYHAAAASSLGNDKYLGIQDFCFYLSLERTLADDYITEKFNDPVLCNAVPIYRGAPNLGLYAYPESYILTEDVPRIDWNQWRQEYEKRLPALKAQKEFLRTRLNVFSYFHLLTEDLSLLDRPRPITR